LRLIIVPRHAERFNEVAAFLDASGASYTRRSKLSYDRKRDATHRRILLVDTIGELRSWWGTAHIAFVGGSFGNRGGQNMIEPAAFGAAVSFGPNTWNFRDIVAALLQAGGAVVVQDTAQLEQFVKRCLQDPGYRDALGRRAQMFVTTQLGATQRTVDLLDRIIDGGPAHERPLAA
jgi:3-deoxy-D-manno-octulosonic-acid transferase